MNWLAISKLGCGRERAKTFLELQRKRYGRTPQQAALSLWKGICTEPSARCIVMDLKNLSRQPHLDGSEKAYLRGVLNHFDHLS